MVNNPYEPPKGDLPAADLAAPNSGRSDTWRWTVCGLLLLATMLNYMDRQTLSLTFGTIQKELNLTPAHYGAIESRFSYAFAVGGFLIGMLVDRFSPRLLYPMVLIGWSLAGICTAYATEVGSAIIASFPGIFTNPEEMSQRDYAAYIGLLACRITLGFFEAGQWPCALVTTQRILSPKDRTFGNSLLQSGASIGAIVTPFIVLSLVVDDVENAATWRLPFLVIGGIGMLWSLPWLWFVRRRDLQSPAEPQRKKADVKVTDVVAAQERELRFGKLALRFGVLFVVVCAINMTWQMFRAWLPLFLENSHGYDLKERSIFTSFFYGATDVGCITAGFAVRRLATIGWGVHKARVVTFTACAVLTAASAIAAAYLPRGPLLLGVLLLTGFGALGLFPNYYSFVQELSQKHLAKISGLLSAAAWFSTGAMQKRIGEYITETESYTLAIVLAGVAPLVACLALWIFWRPGRHDRSN
jgi:ACS family hexuronate transporter-like MFS transporter